MAEDWKESEPRTGEAHSFIHSFNNDLLSTVYLALKAQH